MRAWANVLILVAACHAPPAAGPTPADATSSADSNATLLDEGTASVADASADATLDAPGPLPDAPPTDAPNAPDTPDAPAPAPDIAANADANAAAPLWDLPAIADAGTAACTYTGHHTAFKDSALLDVWNVTYSSWEVVDGVLKPIKIAGFFSRPQGGAVVPGVVLAHGLGGKADEGGANALAARLGMAVLAYSGPGGGDTPETKSEGQASGYANGYRMFDVMKDLRGSWFWGHAVAAMRGVTCLGSRSDVDPQNLGVTGFSAGGVVSTLLAGHDPRVKAAVPLSGTLDWAEAVKAPKAWQHALLQAAGLTTASPEWQTLMAGLIDPGVALAGGTAQLFAVDGTTDEFFPLTALVPTFAAMPGTDKRLSLIANFDHGCYKLSGVEKAADIEARASLRADGAQRAWFRHVFGTDSNYSYIPATPTVASQTVGGATLITATVDPGGSKLQVSEARAWASGDDCFTFVSATLDCKAGVCSKIVPLALQANTVLFVDVTYATKSLLPEKFSLTSLPAIPAGLVPHVRAIDSCL